MREKQVRLSNIELLRILCMFGVLIVHANFGALDIPTKPELIDKTGVCVSRILIESFSIVAVNTFVLLSGWFGIRFKGVALAKLIFQCLFFTCIIYSLYLFYGGTVTIEGLKSCVMLTKNVWFVKCYIGLFLLSPVLNSFVEHTDRKIFKYVIICFFVYQSMYGWLFEAQDWIQHGYSGWSFIGLYLLARYVKVYRPKLSCLKKEYDIMIYVTLSVLTALCMLLFVYIDKYTYFILFMHYTSPLIIIAALYLLLFFSKVNLTSSCINWIASSCFAVYIQHFMIFPLVMNPLIKNVIENNSAFSSLIFISLLLAAFFVVAILIDKVRIFIWNNIMNYFIKRNDRTCFKI